MTIQEVVSYIGLPRPVMVYALRMLRKLCREDVSAWYRVSAYLRYDRTDWLAPRRKRVRK
jgi:hypothetical protein